MTTLKWKRGRDWPNNGDEYMVAECDLGRLTISRELRGRVDPWYTLYLNGDTYVSADWVLKKLKARAYEAAAKEWAEDQHNESIIKMGR